MYLYSATFIVVPRKVEELVFAAQLYGLHVDQVVRDEDTVMCILVHSGNSSGDQMAAAVRHIAAMQ